MFGHFTTLCMKGLKSLDIRSEIRRRSLIINLICTHAPLYFNDFRYSVATETTRNICPKWVINIQNSITKFITSISCIIKALLSLLTLIVIELKSLLLSRLHYTIFQWEIKSKILIYKSYIIYFKNLTDYLSKSFNWWDIDSPSVIKGFWLQSIHVLLVQMFSDIFRGYINGTMG